MPRILVAVNGNFLAHATRPLSLAHTWREAGATVCFAGTGPYMDIPKAAGFDVIPLWTEGRLDTLRLAALETFLNAAWWKQTWNRSIDADLECIAAVRPDVILADMRWSMAWASRVARIPHLAISNAMWVGAALSSLPPGLPTHTLGIVQALQSWQRIAEERGVELSSIWDCTRGWTHTLIADSPAFLPPTDTFSTMSYVGPLCWEGNANLPTWWDTLDPQRPTVYVTTGSSGGDQTHEAAIQALLTHTEYQVLTATGGRALHLPEHPRLFTTTFAPNATFMARSDVVIHHGGSGTLYQAIAAGRPMLGLAAQAHFDQLVNLYQMQKLKLGRVATEAAQLPQLLADVNTATQRSIAQNFQRHGYADPHALRMVYQKLGVG